MISERSIHKIGSNPVITTIKSEIVRVLDDFEREGRALDELPGELVRLGVLISLPVNGPVRTVDAMVDLLAQMSENLPAAWATVMARKSSAGTA